MIYCLSFVIMRLIGLPLPYTVDISLQTALVFFLLYFISGVGEELGWTGYALDPLQNRWGAFKASFILGGVWAIWHGITFLQTGNPVSWVVDQSLKTIAMRMVIVWLYNSTGKSVFAAILYHTTDNVSWSLFPNYGSHYNPFVTGLITWLTMLIVIFGWGRKTLARY